MNIGQQFFGSGTTNPLAANNLGGIGSLVTLFLNIAFVLAGLILLFFFILGESMCTLENLLLLF